MNDAKALLRQFNLRPRKSLGQNFLIDEAALAQIVRLAEVNADDTILEIGPGLGSLTRHLAQVAQRVIAVEIDRQLIPLLRSVLVDQPNVEIVQGDILEIDPVALLQPAGHHPSQPSHYKVVANIPYYITSAIIRHLLEAVVQPESLVLTVQLEVAQRIVAQPDDMNLLAVSVQFYGRPQIVARIKAASFYPRPNVDSAVVRIDLSNSPQVAVHNVETFFAMAKAGFSQKRKQIHNSLAGGLARPREEIDQLLGEAQIDPKRRAETLTLDEWARLADLFDRLKG
jgi:16S rRNA (adenine1518-N6/adenine1519-N6)-dimethyltransferase